MRKHVVSVSASMEFPVWADNEDDAIDSAMIDFAEMVMMDGLDGIGVEAEVTRIEAEEREADPESL